MKSYADIEQSKKLAKILPIESADMHYGSYSSNFVDYPIPNSEDDYKCGYKGLPCWSLAALLAVLPEYTLKNSKFYETVALWCQGISVECDNIVDACYELILKLYELKML